MKKLFTLSLLALLSVQFSSAQEAGFYPPDGSTYNADSSIVTLPSAYLESNYSDTIVFYVSETFSVDLVGQTFELPFNFAEITGVTTPNGMDYSCNPENCYFEPNTSGEVVLYGTPTDTGLYELELTAFVSINAAPLGVNMDLEFEIPYTGGNELLDIALGTDYSVINAVVPTFLINVEPGIIGLEEVSPLANVVVYPNPATSEVSFEFTSANENTQIQIFDLLGNRVFNNTFSNELVRVNTSNFTNGVYIYKLGSANNSSVGRLIVNK
jgi:hypothetical protein